MIATPAPLWCRCVVCGSEETMRHVAGAQYLEPRGWATFRAAYWPVGSEGCSLQLRICGPCFGRVMVVRRANK